MNRERTILRAEKADYKEKLATLKNFIREVTDRCAEHGTEGEHFHDDLSKAKHDAQFYQQQIKEISARLKALAPKANKLDPQANK
jgi:chromosome segregation ATPase